MNRTAGILFFIAIVVGVSQQLKQKSEEGKLAKQLLSNYNKEVRPPTVDGGKTEVRFGMNLIQIMGFNEKTEELTTTLYLEIKWADTRLKWNRSKHSIETIRLPVNSIWVPDIMLENSTNGNLEVGALKVHAIIDHRGSVRWLPPAIHKTSCPIDISLFPFDWQNCSLVYRSASFDQSQMIFLIDEQYGDEVAVDENAFVPNGEWGLIQRPVKIYEQERNDQFQRIAFFLILKRKPQFYVLNMLLPCVVLTLLSCFTFCLPVIAGEKISLSISLLLGQTIFAFLFAQKLPSSSLSIPFAASYLFFSIILLTICIACCVFVCNLHYRRPSDHKLPRWVKVFFFDHLGPLVGMHQPQIKWLHSHMKQKDDNFLKSRKDSNLKFARYSPSQVLFQSQAEKFGFRSRFQSGEIPNYSFNLKVPIPIRSSYLYKQSLDSSRSITKHVRFAKNEEMMTDEWASIAMILDRVLMWIYSLSFIVGTICYFLIIRGYKYPDVDADLQP